jgi:hypothetical protein
MNGNIILAVHFAKTVIYTYKLHKPVNKSNYSFKILLLITGGGTISKI